MCHTHIKWSYGASGLLPTGFAQKKIPGLFPDISLTEFIRCIFLKIYVFKANTVFFVFVLGFHYLKFKHEFPAHCSAVDKLGSSTVPPIVEKWVAWTGLGYSYSVLVLAVLNFWYSYCTRTRELQSNSTRTCTRGQVLRYSYEYWHEYWYSMVHLMICDVRVVK